MQTIGLCCCNDLEDYNGSDEWLLYYCINLFCFNAIIHMSHSYTVASWLAIIQLLPQLAMYIKFASGIAIRGDSRNFVEWFSKQL